MKCSNEQIAPGGHPQSFLFQLIEISLKILRVIFGFFKFVFNKSEHIGINYLLKLYNITCKTIFTGLTSKQGEIYINNMPGEVNKQFFLKF